MRYYVVVMSFKSATGEGGKKRSLSTYILSLKSVASVVSFLSFLIAGNLGRSLGEWLRFLVHLASAHTPFLEMAASCTVSQKLSVLAFCMTFALLDWVRWYSSQVFSYRLFLYRRQSLLATLVNFVHSKFQNDCACDDGFLYGTICSTTFCSVKMIWSM